MSRRQSSILDDILDMLKIAPIWFGPVFAVVMFAFVRYVPPLFIPAKQSGLDLGPVFRPLFPLFSWYVAGAIVLTWVGAEIWKLSNRHLLESQTNAASLNDISWRDFERLVSEAYRRKGYMAEVVGSDSGDGGVDIKPLATPHTTCFANPLDFVL